MDATLDYLDQASYLGLRALGRGPVNQIIWVYRRPVNLAALRDFHGRLGGGLLGRLVEPSPLPFGRHRWVRAAGPALELIEEVLPAEQLGEWLDGQQALTIDPEHGPGWRLVVRSLTGGGAVVVLLVSHTLADGLGSFQAITDAVTATQRALPYPPPAARSRSRAVREDVRTTLQSLPDAGRAVAAAWTLARNSRGPLTESARRAGPPPRAGSRAVVVPSALLTADAAAWTRRAQQLRGNDISLMAGLAAVVGRRLGRTAADGTVRLVLPVSARTPGDTRGNALSAITVAADPRIAASDLRPLRAAIRTELQELSEQGSALFAPAALSPFIPRAIARRLEGMARGTNQAVGCSALGRVDPAANRPDGSDADALWIRSIEPFTRDDLARLQGTLLVASVIVDGRMGVVVAGWQPGRVESRADLAACVAAGANEMGLAFRLE